MLRPSFNEIPQGFGPVSESSNLALTSLTTVNAATVRCSLVALSDVGHINRYGAGQTLTTGQWCAVGGFVPSDLALREPYMVSLKGFGRFSAAGGVVIPFCGSTTSTGGNATVTVHDILPGEQSSGGLHALADFVGCVRPGQVFDSVLPAGSSFVFGLIFGNPTAVSVDLLSYRSSISVLRAAFPDNAMSFSVN